VIFAKWSKIPLPYLRNSDKKGKSPGAESLNLTIFPSCFAQERYFEPCELITPLELRLLAQSVQTVFPQNNIYRVCIELIAVMKVHPGIPF
jgi:hypothetical protein